MGAGGKWPGRQQLIAVQGHGLEKKKNLQRTCQPLEGALGLQTARLIPLCPSTPSPKGGNSVRFSPGPHLGLQKFACCLTTIYFLSSNFTGCQLSAFPIFLSPTLSSTHVLFDKRVQRQIGQSASTQRDLRSPPQLTPPPLEETAQRRGSSGRTTTVAAECSLWGRDSFPGCDPSLRKKLKWFQSNSSPSSPRIGAHAVL